MQKPKRNTWTKDNSAKMLIACGLPPASVEMIRKENARVKKFLELKGWTYRESVNIYERGLVWTFSKKLEGRGLQRPIIHFDWHWDQEVGDPYLHGNLHGSFDCYPGDKFYHPNLMVEIWPVLDKNLKDIEILENRLVESLYNLTIVG